ncbi:ATP-binding protein, partial [bacterium]|nr:ATP-binding protein [bacterium]
DAYRALAPKTEDQELAAIIAAGESQKVEFKASARWDQYQNKPSKEVEGAIIKTVAAFLNTDGGDLLIGVNDEAKAVGLMNDFKTLGKRQNVDGFENFLMTFLTDAMGKNVSSLLRITFHKIDGLDVCRINVKPSPKEVFVREGNLEPLYIRAGNSTRLLNTREAIEYCKTHWPV